MSAHAWLARLSPQVLGPVSTEGEILRRRVGARRDARRHACGHYSDCSECSPHPGQGQRHRLALRHRPPPRDPRLRPELKYRPQVASMYQQESSLTTSVAASFLCESAALPRSTCRSAGRTASARPAHLELARNCGRPPRWQRAPAVLFRRRQLHRCGPLGRSCRVGQLSRPQRPRVWYGGGAAPF